VLLQVAKIVESNKAEIAFPTSTLHIAELEALADSQGSNTKSEK
jgi:hypothetical protein